MESNPKLRYLEAQPFQEDGKNLVVLKDPMGISEEVLAAPPELCFVLSLLDGHRSMEQIVEEVEKQAGQDFTSAHLQAVLDRLDQVYFLDNDRFRSRHRRVIDDFRKLPLRRPAHAGISYPGQSADLIRRISSFYTHPNGAGLPGDRTERRIKGLIAPHIDLRLGGPCYTHAYRPLAESRIPDLFVILGTAHMGVPELFSVSEKDFETPLGTVQCDREFAARLRGILGDGFREDLSHRHEHTIEFQTIFLQHLLRGREFKILPVLVGFSYLHLREPGLAEEGRRLFDDFIHAMKEAESLSGKRVCYLSSIDLAHIGPLYGDDFKMDEERITDIKTRDARMLDLVKAGDAEGFFGFVEEERDSRRICGFSPLYAFLTLLEAKPVQVRAHDHALMDEAGSFVTFTSGVVYEGAD